VADEHAFFDLQVNGYMGVDFNADALSAEQLSKACEHLRRDGVDGILATLITDDVDRMAARVRNLVRARAEVPLAQAIVRGIHLEGPFINETPGFVGAHSARAVRPASVAAIEPLVDGGEGLVRLVTLAPERDARMQTTRWLVDHGICVSAGHCDASLDELRAAIDSGLSMFTHLGNGCPLVLHRHDNIIQRVLRLAEQLWICFIVDGVHVPFTALRNYIKFVGLERTIVVSDAIAAAGLGPGEFTLGAMKVVVDEQLATWAADRNHLMGSAMTMPQAHANLRSHLELSTADARRLTSENPRIALGLAAR
jgi:N-acetylglucosamine-6-phosphate deacetylase